MLLFDGPRQHDDLACAARRSAQNLASSRSRRPAFEAPCEAAQLRLATARGAIHRRASLRMRARRACPSRRLPATLRPARVRSRTTPDAWRARSPGVRHARHDGTRPRRMPSTPATLRPPRAGGVAPRHSQSGAQRACSGRGMRFRPPPSAQGYVRGVPRARRERAQRALPSSAGAASRSPRPPARGRSSRREGKAPGRARRAYARPRRGARSGGGAGPRDTARARRSSGRRALRASPAPRRAPSRASPGRARRARSRPRRRRTLREPRSLSDRRLAQHFAGEPSLERDRRAAPSRCLEAREQAHRRAGRLASMRRGDRPLRVRAPRR